MVLRRVRNVLGTSEKCWLDSHAGLPEGRNTTAMNRYTKVLDMIVADMDRDVLRDEGLPFTGDNVARSLGEIRAAVSALALVMLAATGEDTTP